MSRGLYRLFIVTILLLNTSSASAAEISVDTYTQSGPLAITVIFKEGWQDWAQSILDQSPAYIRSVEYYLKSRYQWGSNLKIEGCDNCTSHADIPSHTIYLNYQYSTAEDVSVLFHEINHFWFYYHLNNSSEEWLIEGISSFLPNAIRDKKLIADIPLYHQTIDRYWGLEWVLPEDIKDVALVPFNEGLRKLVYTKSYRLQYLFYCLLGKKNYLRFVKQVSKMKRRKPSQVISLLNGYRKLNWKKIITGWVQGNKYKNISLADFTIDADSDGLSQAKEYCYGSNPEKPDSDGDTLPDGAEKSLGRNPLRSDADGRELVSKYGPFVDGAEKDWFLLSAGLSTEPASDTIGPVWTDMQQMLTIVRNGILYVLIRTAARPESSSALFFDLLVDTNNDYQTDEEFAFFLSSPNSPWHYTAASGRSEYLISLQAARGDYIEMGIPLSAIPAQTFRVLPIIRNDLLKVNQDEWAEWVTIN